MDLTSDTVQLLLNTGRGTGSIVNPTGVRLLPLAILPQPGGSYSISPVPPSLFVAPVSINKTIPVYDAASFVEYFESYSDKNSRIFVDTQSRLITAILDYHEKRESEAVGVARWGSHILKHVFRTTRKWDAWYKMSVVQNKEGFGQEDFADFLEEHADDIVEPEKATITDMANGIYASTHDSFAGHKRNAKGSTEFTYTTETTAKTQAGYEIPNSFVIRVIPFEGTEEVSVKCLLRYTADKNRKPAVKFSYRMLGVDQVMDEAVEVVHQVIAQSIKSHPFTKGTP